MGVGGGEGGDICNATRRFFKRDLANTQILR